MVRLERSKLYGSFDTAVSNFSSPIIDQDGDDVKPAEYIARVTAAIAEAVARNTDGEYVRAIAKFIAKWTNGHDIVGRPHARCVEVRIQLPCALSLKEFDSK